MRERIRRINRGLLELETGILAWGALCQLTGVWLAGDKAAYSGALWLGAGMAAAAALHMYRTLDRALDLGDRAQRIVALGSLARYGCILLILTALALTKVFNPLIAFLGLMGLKAGAYLQPLTHRCYNWLFHETDPVPQAMPEDPEAASDIVQKEE